MLRCPASVIDSHHDANYVAFPRLHVDPLVSLRPGLAVELVDDVGHFMLAEAPQRVADHLRRHVR